MQTTQKEFPCFAAALLAGGASFRMRRDKAMIPVQFNNTQMALWQRQWIVLARMKPAQMMISGPRKDAYPTSIHIIPDRWPGIGPVSGLGTCLEWMTAPFLLVLAVDLAQISEACLRALLHQVTSGCGVIPAQHGRYEPLAAIYPKKSLHIVAEFLKRDGRRLQRLSQLLVESKLVKCWPIPPELSSDFNNWNRPEDIRIQSRQIDEA